MKYKYTGSHPMFVSIGGKSAVVHPSEIIEAKVTPNSLFVAVNKEKAVVAPKVEAAKNGVKPASKTRKPRGPLDARNS